MEYFKSGGEDWKEVRLRLCKVVNQVVSQIAPDSIIYQYDTFEQILERSYPKDPPKVEPPQFNKQMVYENNCHVFEQVSKNL